MVKPTSIISDHLGTPILAIDSEGNEVWNRQLDIYGRVRKEYKHSSLGDEVFPFVPFLYQGQYYDFETELCYNRFRYYSPETGAYISQDPIRLNGNNPNLYAYVGNCNWWIDVFGLDCNQLNLDTGTVRTLLDGSTDEVDKMINNRDLVISETAMKEARAYAERSNRLEELDKLLIDKNITMIPDNPSERAKKLKPTKKLQENDIVIFGLVIIWEYKP